MGSIKVTLQCSFNTNVEKAKISFYACYLEKGPKISSVFRLKCFHWKQTKRMKLFELHKENLEILGIHANQQHAFHGMKIQIAHLALYVGSILGTIFFFSQIKSFRDYTDSIYTTSAIIGITISFTHITFQTDKLFQFIENCQKLMDNRKLKSNWPNLIVASENGQFLSNQLIFSSLESNPIYHGSIAVPEKWNKIIYFAAAKISPVCWVASKLILTLFAYVTTNNFDHDTLELPLPLWWILNTVFKNWLNYLVNKCGR